MAQYMVEMTREEISYSRCYVTVNAETPEQAREKVRLHYIEDHHELTPEEETTEWEAKCLGIEDSRVVKVGEAKER